jgi:hypothetical protein
MKSEFLYDLFALDFVDEGIKTISRVIVIHIIEENIGVDWHTIYYCIIQQMTELPNRKNASVM